MSSYRQILFHIIFRTKESKKALLGDTRELYAYITGIVRNKSGFLYQINGTEDHIHFLSDLHPSFALADFMREIKTSTSIWIKHRNKFPGFSGWADGYAALTYGLRDKDRIVNYIKNQQVHHMQESFEDVYRRLLIGNGIVIDERYFP